PSSADVGGPMRHNRTVSLGLGLAAGLLIATSAAADTARDMLRGRACFTRSYDRTHLRLHPRQTVRSFYLHAVGPEWRATDTRRPRRLPLASFTRGRRCSGGDFIANLRRSSISGGQTWTAPKPPRVDSTPTRWRRSRIR